MGFRREGIEIEVASAARDLLDGLWNGGARATRNADDPLPEAWDAASDAGWFDLLVAEDDGGLGLGPVVAGGVLEQVGRHLLPGPVGDTMAGAAVVRSAGVELKPGAALTVAGDRSRVTTLVDGRLTASLRAEWADVADAMILRVDTPEGPGGLAVLEHGSNGVEVSVQATLDRFRRPCTVTLTGVMPTAILDDPSGERWQTLLNHRLALAAAELLGLADHVLELSVAYAGTREQFGTPISTFQAVRHRLADMAVHVESVRSACYLAQIAVRDSAEADTLASVAKAHASRTVREVVESALQVHGGVGFTAEHELSGYFLRALSLQSAIADDMELRRELARRALSHADVSAGS